MGLGLICLGMLPPGFLRKSTRKHLDTGCLHPDGLKHPFRIYSTSSTNLALRYAKDPLSLSEEEKSKLKWEGNFQERSILESTCPSLPTNDPTLIAINERLTFQTEEGFEIIL